MINWWKKEKIIKQPNENKYKGKKKLKTWYKHRGLRESNFVGNNNAQNGNFSGKDG